MRNARFLFAKVEELVRFLRFVALRSRILHRRGAYGTCAASSIMHAAYNIINPRFDRIGAYFFLLYSEIEKLNSDAFGIILARFLLGSTLLFYIHIVFNEVFNCFVRYKIIWQLCKLL